MGLKRITLLLLAAILSLPACSRDEGSASIELPSSDASVTEPAATPSPPPTATPPPTNTPEPTPIVPSIEVNAQTVTEDGRILIDKVIIPDAGWLVIYQEADGGAGDLLGYERLVPGENSAVTVTIEPRQAAPSLIAQLHEDAGEIGEFEYPGPDAALSSGTAVVAETFPVDIQLPIPSIDVSTQALGADGLVKADSVFALQPGWLVVHNYHDGEVGTALGQIPVQAGHNNDLSFPIRWRVAATELLAILYEDEEQPGGFDKEVDLPVLDEGSAVVAEFSVSLPPDILVYDQPVQEGKIIIERATSSGPGWIVAYYDEEDRPGRIIGSAYIVDGVNELVDLEVLETAVTQRMFILMHEDTGTLGKFDFPADDLPIVHDGQPLPPFIMHTTPGNYLITKDQPLGDEGSIVVPLVITDLDIWLVIYNIDAAGEANEVIGQTRLTAGINRDVELFIDSDRATETLLAILHQDLAPLEQFDYPNGNDTPLLRNLLPIQSPFLLQIAPEDDRPLP